MAPTVGYWDIRGLAEPIRLILHHVGEEFVDKRYKFGPEIETCRQEWLDEKYELGLKFPNIPYYIDGDLKMTQNIAIVRYLAKKHGLYPTNEHDEVEASVLEQVSQDILQDVVRLAYAQGPPPDPKFAEFRKKKNEEVVGFISKSLGDDDWLVGNQLSYADFLIVQSLDHLAYLNPGAVRTYPNLVALIKRFEALPNVEKYLKSAAYVIWPLYSPYATWSGSGEPPEREIF